MNESKKDEAIRKIKKLMALADPNRGGTSSEGEADAIKIVELPGSILNKRGCMKVLVLVIVTTWSFFGTQGNAPAVKVVGSIQEAALEVWNTERSRVGAEPDRYEYRLYEIDFDAETMKKINIPSVKFEDTTNKGE